VKRTVLLCLRSSIAVGAGLVFLRGTADLALDFPLFMPSHHLAIVACFAFAGLLTAVIAPRAPLLHAIALGTMPAGWLGAQVVRFLLEHPVEDAVHVLPDVYVLLAVSIAAPALGGFVARWRHDSTRGPSPEPSRPGE